MCWFQTCAPFVTHTDCCTDREGSFSTRVWLKHGRIFCTAHPAVVSESLFVYKPINSGNAESSPSHTPTSTEYCQPLLSKTPNTCQFDSFRCRNQHQFPDDLSAVTLQNIPCVLYSKEWPTSNLMRRLRFPFSDECVQLFFRALRLLQNEFR